MEPLGNIHHPKYEGKRHHNYTHGLTKFKENWKPENCKSPMRVLTINLPQTIIDFIDNELKGIGKLYSSRSEAIRNYTIRGLQDDIDVMRATSGEFVSHPLYPENKDTFTDQYGTVWKIKEGT